MYGRCKYGEVMSSYRKICTEMPTSFVSAGVILSLTILSFGGGSLTLVGYTFCWGNRCFLELGLW